MLLEQPEPTRPHRLVFGTQPSIWGWAPCWRAWANGDGGTSQVYSYRREKSRVIETP